MSASKDLFLQILDRFPDADIKVEKREDAVIVTPKNGFVVSLYAESEEDTMVAAERWHAHYDDPQQAAFCAYWLLTPYYRIAQEFKGSLFVATWTEMYTAEGWAADEPVYYLNPEYAPDWELGPGETFLIRYRSQNTLGPIKPFDEICPGSPLDSGGFPVGWETESEEISDESFGLMMAADQS